MEGSSEMHQSFGIGNELTFFSILLQCLEQRESQLKFRIAELEQKLTVTAKYNEELRRNAQVTDARLMKARRRLAVAERRAEKAEHDLRVMKMKRQSDPNRSSAKTERWAPPVGEGPDEISEVWPKWFTETIPRRSPYFPQIGDELIYFRQGLLSYVNQVARLNIYPVDRKQRDFSFVETLNLEELVRVVDMHFEIIPYRLVSLKLQKIDWETGQSLDNFFWIRYHHLASVPDFLILRQIYDKSMQNQWEAGQRFRSMTDNLTWRVGKVLEWGRHLWRFAPAFRTFLVKWEGNDDQEPEELSPWDMEVIPGGNFVAAKYAKNEVPVTAEEYQNSLYQVDPNDWQPLGQKAECQRLLSLLEDLMNHPFVQPFCTSSYITSRPDYVHKIAYPIDLSTIKARLDSLFYRRPQAIYTDIDMIAFNTNLLYEPDSDISEHSRWITMFLRA